MTQEPGPATAEVTEEPRELVVGVRFQRVGKVYHFDAGREALVGSEPVIGFRPRS